MVQFEVLRAPRKSNARLGRLTTPHGDIETPVFMPVGTQATVKSLDSADIENLGAQIILANTYHLHLRPGEDLIADFGGLHKFMNWNHPILTDSGGFQVFSLGAKRFARKNEDGQGEASLVRISDDGVTFKSHWDGKEYLFTPENSMQYQNDLGSDIHIAFDDCTPYPVTKKQAEKSMQRTHQWAKRSLAAHKNGALYGSIQGSVYEELRVASTEFITSFPFDGFAIGGVSVGESKKEMEQVLSWVTPILPQDKPRHLLGVGEIDDIYTLISHGIDTFDCVQPTRLARMGIVFVDNQKVDITKIEYEKDIHPIDDTCQCYTCKYYSRAYVHHLFHVRELLGYRLATIHNLFFVNALVREMREAIGNGTFPRYNKERR